MIRIQKQTLLYNVPLVFALMITFVSVFLIERGVLAQTGGILMYPLDDPFIHMELAKNLAFHGTWGINPGEFASASSSILYTVLLAASFKLFSVHDAVPLIINSIAAFFLLLFIHNWLVRQKVNTRGRTIILLLIVFFLPLPVLVISGMEHTLQCVFSFLFITRFAEWISCNDETKEIHRNNVPWSLLGYAFLVTAIRYEGLFLIAIACGILLFKRKLYIPLLLGAVALVPVLIFGFISVYNNNYFLPNPLYIKSEGLQFSVRGVLDFFSNILINKYTISNQKGIYPGVPPPGISLLATQRILVVIPVIYLLFSKTIKEKSAYFYMLLMLLLTTLLHLAFASTGWFYRYEAYLILITCVITFTVLFKYGAMLWQETPFLKRLFIVILLFSLFFPFVLRSTAALTKAKQACINIYEQQYQMASFLEKYYSGKVVAANDIGAISYYTDVKIIDLWGLGSIEIARSKKEKYWTPAFLNSLVRERQVDVVIIYDEWFGNELIRNWKKVATWQISDNVITGGETVSFYVMNEEEGYELKKNLQLYEPLLPRSVKVNYK